MHVRVRELCAQGRVLLCTHIIQTRKTTTPRDLASIGRCGHALEEDTRTSRTPRRPSPDRGCEGMSSSSSTLRPGSVNLGFGAMGEVESDGDLCAW
jgi:hypothetical protein